MHPPYATHAVITRSHRLVIDLPADFPEGEVEVLLRPIASPQLVEYGQVLGRTLRAIRQKSLDAGMTLLDWDGINREVQQRRGGSADE